MHNECIFIERINIHFSPFAKKGKKKKHGFITHARYGRRIGKMSPIKRKNVESNI